jgi:type I restriction enzyme S subunit
LHGNKVGKPTTGISSSFLAANPENRTYSRKATAKFARAAATPVVKTTKAIKSYPSVPRNAIGEGLVIKTGWQTKTLGDACQIARGGSPRPIQDFMTNDLDGVNWVKISDATASGKFIYETKEKIKPSGVARSRLVNPGDFLLSNSMSFGRPYIMQTTGCIHDGWLVLSDYEKYFDQGFLYHLLGSPVVFEQFDRLAAGSTVRNLNIELASRVLLPVPPLPEQQRIVTILDEAFDGIATAKAHAEKNLQNARAIFESHLQSVFTDQRDGWVEHRLKSLTTKIGSGATPRGGEESYKAEGISLIRSLNVHDMAFKYAKLAFLDDAQADELSNVAVKSRDVLLNITGASVARCTIVPDDVLPARVNQHVAIIRPIAEKLDADFLHYLLISKPYKDQLLKTGEEGGSTRQALTKAQIQEFLVTFPETLSEQKAVVAKLDVMLAETQRLEAVYQQKLTALDELKKSLLYRAFNGDL